MYGAIIGDLAGSLYEYSEFIDAKNGIINLKRRQMVKDKPLLNENCFFSDDTILTIAVLESILAKIPFEDNLKKYALQYQDLKPATSKYFAGMFSPRFIKWCHGALLSPSYGNGAAMRISPVAYLYNDMKTINKMVLQVTKPSHNHKEALKGALALAEAIYLARLKTKASDIKVYLEKKYKYDLNYDLSQLQVNNTFDSTAKVTVPQSLFLALEAHSFEEALKNALSIGGDSDTIACMTGALAEALFEIPPALLNESQKFLPHDFQKILTRGYRITK